jgi:2-C-methyl-D-erythritol 2,4-cyclodiphosphate synthase
MRAILAARALPVDTYPQAPGTRAGIGFDAHRLAEGRPRRLAGLTWPDEARGPLGHSDGDVVLHALIDALLGAAALGDIGTHFPPGEEAWSGADSVELLAQAGMRLAKAGWRPVSVDVTVAAVSPPIATRRDDVVARIAELLRIGPDAVSVKGTTSDGLGFTGSEGIAAWAVATIEPTR